MTHKHPTWREVVRQVDRLADENEALRAENERLKNHIDFNIETLNRIQSDTSMHSLSDEEYVALCEIRKNATS